MTLNPLSCLLFYTMTFYAFPSNVSQTKQGTFQNRAKVVDSLPGDTLGIAECRHDLAPRAKRSMRLNFSTDGTITPLERPVVGCCALKRLEALRSLGRESSSADSSTHRC